MSLKLKNCKLGYITDDMHLNTEGCYFVSVAVNDKHYSAPINTEF